MAIYSTNLMIERLDYYAPERVDFSLPIVFWILGIVSWFYIYAISRGIRKIPNLPYVRQFNDELKLLIPELKSWVRDFRIFSEKLSFAELQIQNSKAPQGELVNTYSNGVSLYKFAIAQNDEFLGSLKGLFSSFSDNTSTQTYVAGSSSSGKLSPSAYNDGKYHYSGSTTNSIRSEQTGLAYVAIEGDDLVPRVIAFANPNEARDFYNRANQLSSDFEKNRAGSKGDTESWQKQLVQRQGNLNAFLEGSSAFRSRLRKIPLELVSNEFSNSYFSFDRQYLTDSDLKGLTYPDV